MKPAMTIRSPRHGCATSILFLGMLASALAAAECQMAKVATFPLELAGNSFLIRGQLNGLDILILADTGAAESVIWLDAAKRAGLRPVTDRRYKMVGVSGETQVYKVKVDELVIGDFTLRGKTWPAIGSDNFGEGLGMILGVDFWSRVDFEINLAEQEIVLWETHDCAKAPLAYWNKDFMLALLEDTNGRSINTEVLISGTKVEAMLDTGAEVTLMDSRLARRIGFRPDPSDADSGGEVRGIGDKGAVQSFVATFDSFALGDLTIKNAKIRALDMDRHIRSHGSRIRTRIVDIDDLILGADFLRANRVLVANSQGYLYMTYNGGRVFQTEAPELALEPADDAPIMPADMEQLIERAMKEGNIQFGGDVPLDVQRSLRAGLRARSKGRTDEAEQQFRKALEELERNGKAESEIAIWVMSQLASVLVEQNKFGETETIYVRMLLINEKLYGAEHQSRESMLSDLGVVYMSQDKNSDAATTFQQALSFSEKAHGPESMETTYVLMNLGWALERTGNYVDAESQFRRVISNMETQSELDVVKVAEALLDVGRSAEALDRYGEAKANYLRAREIFANKLGTEHEMTRHADEMLELVWEAAKSDQ